MRTIKTYSKGAPFYNALISCARRREKSCVYWKYGAYVASTNDKVIWVEDAKGNIAPMRVEFFRKTFGYP
jgi:hypothetical protein